MAYCSLNTAALIAVALNRTPLLRDLVSFITPRYAAHWRIIGILLEIQKGELDAIECAYPTNFS